jgi:hypothetical protein
MKIGDRTNGRKNFSKYGQEVTRGRSRGGKGRGDLGGRGSEEREGEKILLGGYKRGFGKVQNFQIWKRIKNFGIHLSESVSSFCDHPWKNKHPYLLYIFFWPPKLFRVSRNFQICDIGKYFSFKTKFSLLGVLKNNWHKLKLRKLN